MAKTINHPIRELQVLPGASLPHFTQQKFRRQTAHIALMFLRSLTQNSITLDGSPLVFVYFGMPEAQREQLGKANYFRETKGNWSSCCVPKFDWDVFSKLTEREQDELTTKLLEKGLLTIAKATGVDGQPIKRTAKAIRTSEYSMRFAIDRLTCTNDSKDLVACVYSVVTRGMIRWQIEVQDADYRVVQSAFVPDDCYSKPDFSEDRVTARWKKNVFSIVSSKGRAVYSLTIDR